MEDTLKKALIETSPECSEGLKPYLAHKLTSEDRLNAQDPSLGFDFSGEIKLL